MKKKKKNENERKWTVKNAKKSQALEIEQDFTCCNIQTIAAIKQKKTYKGNKKYI